MPPSRSRRRSARPKSARKRRSSARLAALRTMSRTRANKTLTKTQARKKEHLEICLDTESVSSHSSTGLDRYRFIHNALPELDLDEIDVGTAFLGKTLRAPILISSMT